MFIVEKEGNTAVLGEGFKDVNTYVRANLPRKVEALFDHKDFQPKISWMAQMLNVSLNEIQDALDLLESLNFIYWENGRPIKTDNEHMKLNKMGYTTNKDRLVSDHRIISHQLLNDIDPNNRFFVHNGFLASDAETLKEYYSKLLEVQNWFIEQSKNSKKDLIVGYSFTGANVVKLQDGELS